MFEAKIHRYSTQFSGDVKAAMNVARTALLSQGFEIVADTGSTLHAHGPGMRSNRESPLLGATDFRIEVGASTVATTATLGGVAKMKAFLYLFPNAMALSFAIPMWYAGRDAWGVLLFAVPWLVLSPWMAKGLERSTIRAIDGLIRGMAQAASHG